MLRCARGCPEIKPGWRCRARLTCALVSSEAPLEENINPAKHASLKTPSVLPGGPREPGEAHGEAAPLHADVRDPANAFHPADAAASQH